MPFAIVHADTGLYGVQPGGTVNTLTLPAGVTLVNTRACRYAVLNGYLVIVGGVSRNLFLDVNGVLQILTPISPTAKPTTASGGAGALTGEYRYLYTFCQTDGGGNILTESGPSPVSDPAIVLAAERVSVSGIAVSTEAQIDARRLYRTASNGSEYFLVTTILDNTTTTYSDNNTDDDISLFPIDPDLGTPPTEDGSGTYFEEIVAWKNRLWACANVEPDRTYYCGLIKPYAWSPINYLDTQPVNSDDFGVSTYAVRRNELLIGRKRSLWKIIGSSESNFEMIQVAEGIGFWAPRSAVTIRDEVFFLAEDGVYSYGPAGLRPLSRNKVNPWFSGSDVFNKAALASAFGLWNQQIDAYELYLPATGQSTLNRWISLDLRALAGGEVIWLGPHKTTAVTPTCGANVEDNNALQYPFLGGADGWLYQKNRPIRADEGAAIDFDVIGKFHSAGEPDRDKYWGQLSVFTKVEPGGTLDVLATRGRLDSTDTQLMAHDLTTGRERLPRLGHGAMVQLRFRNAELNQRVELYGYEVDAVWDHGRR